MGTAHHTLSIVIPKQDYCIEALIQRLRYLETPACRRAVSEEWRLQERSEVTKQFRKALEMRDFFNAHHEKMYNDSKMVVDEYYK